MNQVPVFAAAAALIAFPALADTRMTYVDDASGAPRSTITIKDGKARMDQAGDETYALFDARSDTLVVVDARRRTWTRLDEASMRRLSGEVSEAMAEMRRQMEQMPPEQRAAMERMMGGADKPLDITVKRSGRKMEKAGHECEHVTLSVNGTPRSEMCVVKAGELGIPADDRETLDAMYARMQKISESLVQGMGGSAGFDIDAIGGMPVYMKQDRQASGEVLDKITRDRVDASLFEVPEGYREESVATAQ